MWLAEDGHVPLASLRRSHSEAFEDDDHPVWGTEDRRLRPSRRPPNPEGRRPVLAAIGVLVVVGCTALGAEVAARIDHRAGYLAVATYVPQGSVITSGDLSVVSMTSPSGVALIPSADAPSVLGRRASELLEPGSLLVPGDLSDTLPLPDGDALVGTSLGTDQAPAGLTPGASVLVVLSGASSAESIGSPNPSGAPGSGASGAEGQLAVGTVYAVVLPSVSDEAASSEDELVTLEVPESAAAVVTAASAAGDVSLAEVSDKAAVASAGQIRTRSRS
jgi:hypothetical protein